MTPPPPKYQMVTEEFSSSLRPMTHCPCWRQGMSILCLIHCNCQIIFVWTWNLFDLANATRDIWPPRTFPKDHRSTHSAPPFETTIYHWILFTKVEKKKYLELGWNDHRNEVIFVRLLRFTISLAENLCCACFFFNPYKIEKRKKNLI